MSSQKVRPSPNVVTIDVRDDVVRLRSALSAAEAAFFSLVERSSDGMLIVDDGGIIRFANAAASVLLGRSGQDLVGSDVGFAVLANDSTEVEVIRPDGQLAFAEIRVVETEWEGRHCMLALLRDITERHEVEAELARRATHDHLTGLPNRFLLEDRLGLALGRLGRAAASLALFVADLDDFKAVNDRFGHSTGDAVLVEAARRIRSVLRPADTVARTGGDEFVLLCEAMERPAADELATRLVQAFEQPVVVDGHVCEVGLSIGYALAREPAADAERLLAEADAQMYQHKRRLYAQEGGEHRSVTSAREGDVVQPAASARRKHKPAHPAFRFTLYTAGTNARSSAARLDLDRLCRTRLAPGSFDITVVDVLHSLQDADAARVLVTPTLVRSHPPPAVRVIGDLSDTTRIAEALGLPGSTRG